jgi:hypothetical protein
VWEISSLIAVLGLWPVMLWFYGRFVQPVSGKLRFFLLLAIMFLGVSFSHIGLMVAMRKISYAVMGTFYDFSHGELGLQLVYEMRKDLLSFAAQVGFFWLTAQLYPDAAPEKKATGADKRLEIRVDGRTLFLDPEEVWLVEAAGNYVEMHMKDKTHMVRGMLSTFETQLQAHGFVRVHRSRLVNRASIRAIEPTSSGDLKITMEGGRTILGSRRFRDALKTENA